MYRNILNPNCKTPSIGHLKAIKKLMVERNLYDKITPKICNDTNLLEFSSKQKKDKDNQEVFFTVNTNDVEENTLKRWNYEITEKVRWFEHALNVMFVQIQTKYDMIMQNMNKMTSGGNFDDEVKQFKDFVENQKKLIEKGKDSKNGKLIEAVENIKDIDVDKMTELLKDEKFINMMKCYFAGKDK
jgi:hypothetical protein